jgi:DNA primase
MIEKHIIEMIEDSVSLSNVISKYVKIRRAGSGRFEALCPFHKEDTPSFKIDDSKGVYKCFGCQKTGNAFKFLQDYKNMSFVEAVEYVADIANIRIDRSNKAENHDYENAYKIMSTCSDFFQINLINNKKAYDYLIKRGFSQEIISQFKFGFANDSFDDLIKHASKSGIKIDDLERCGLVRKSESGKYYDFFRNRIMIPILDKKSRVIGFGARVVDDSLPKYINSPESKIFNKRNVLFNIDNASKANFEDKQNIIVVEGYLDVISLCQNGIKSAVAPLGTSITEYHLEKIYNIDKSPIFFLDSDRAGVDASFKIAKMSLVLLDKMINPKFVTIDYAKDPDECIKLYGINGINKAIKNALDLPSFVFGFLSKDVDFKNAVQVSQLILKFKEITKEIKDYDMVKQYNYFLNDKLYLAKKGLYKKISSFQKKNSIVKIDKIDNIRYAIIGSLISNVDLHNDIDDGMLDLISNDEKIGDIFHLVVNHEFDKIETSISKDEILLIKNFSTQKANKDQFYKLIQLYRLENLKNEEIVLHKKTIEEMDENIKKDLEFRRDVITSEMLAIESSLL